MNFQVNKTDEGHLHIIVDDVACVGVDKRSMDEKDKDNYDPDWQAKLAGRVCSCLNPRTEECFGALSEDEDKALTEAVNAVLDEKGK